MEFLENLALLRGRDTKACIPNVDTQTIAASAAANQHAAVEGIFDGVGNKVLYQPAKQPAVRAHSQRVCNEHKFESFFPRERREFHLDLTQQLIDTEGAYFRLQSAGVESRDVEQRAEDFFNSFERSIDVADEACIGASFLAFDKAC